MADYDLGTAHGRVVIDYKDKGTAEAGKHLDALAAKAKSLLGQFSAIRKKWSSDASAIVSDAEQVAKTFSILAGSVAFAAGVFTRTGGTLAGLRGGVMVLRSLGLALGSVPRGAEGFPNVIKRMIQLSAAISLFSAATGILARSTSRFLILGAITGMLGRFGGVVAGLFGPLHAVAGAALSVATVVMQLRMVGSLVKPIIGLNTALGGLAGGLYAAAYLATGLYQALVQLSGVAGLLPAGIGVAILAVATLKVGLMGLSDAFKAMDDPKKFAEELKKLSPAAREFATAIRDIKNKGFKELQLEVQQKLFQGLGATVTQLGGKYLPLLRTNMAGVATTINSVVTQVARMLMVPDMFGRMTAMGTKFRQILANLGQAVAPLVEALLIVMDVGASVFVELTQGAGKAAQGFRDFIKNAADTGKLREWIMNGIQGFKDLIAIVRNVGAIIKTIFVGLNGGEGANFLATIRGATQAFNEFLNSAQGQEILGMIGDQLRIFADHARALGEAFMTYVLPAIKTFTPLVQTLSDAFNAGLIQAVAILGPLFGFLGTVMSALAPVTGPIVQTLVTLGVTLFGLGIAAKLIGAQLLILRTGLMAMKGAWTVAAFGARLLTGNLRTGEAAVLRFIGSMIAGMARGLAAWIAGIARWVAATVAGAARVVASAVASAARWVAAWAVAIAQTIARWTVMAAVATANAARVAAIWVASAVAAGARMAAAWAVAAAQVIARWALMAAAATANAIRIGLAWVISGGAAVATYIAGLVVAAAATVAQWALMAAGALAGAARMAIAWLIALGPIGLLVAAVAIVVALVIMYWDQIVAAAVAFGAMLMAAWNAIWAFIGPPVMAAVAIVAAAFNAMMAVINAVISTITSIVQTGIALIVAIFSGDFATVGQIVSQIGSTILSAITGAMTGMANAVNTGIARVIQFFVQLGVRAIAELTSLAGRMVAAGVAIIQGIVRGLQSAAGQVISFLTGLASRALAAVKGFFGISSPSKVMAEVGQNVGLGLANGIASMTGTVIRTAQRLSDEASAALVPEVPNNLNMGFARAAVAGGAAAARPYAASTPVAGAPRVPVAGSTKGGDGASANTFNVTIPAKDIAEMKNVADFFDKVQQKARAGKATR